MKRGECWSHIVKGTVANQLGHLRECAFAHHVLRRTVCESCSTMFNHEVSAVAREPALLGQRFPFKNGHGLKTKRPRAHIYIELLRWGA